MTPYTDEQKADLAKRIEARAAALGKWGWCLRELATEIRDGTFFEVQHD